MIGIMLAKQGYPVKIMEGRKDMRKYLFYLNLLGCLTKSADQLIFLSQSEAFKPWNKSDLRSNWLKYPSLWSVVWYMISMVRLIFKDMESMTPKYDNQFQSKGNILSVKKWSELWAIKISWKYTRYRD